MLAIQTSLKRNLPPDCGRTPKLMKTKQAIQAERNFSMSRRNFLRGLGACVALPAFESLSFAGAPAARFGVTASGAPLRTAFLFFPNGAIPSAWWPKEAGENYEFSRTLKPLEPLRQHLQVLGGLDQTSAE